MAKRKTHSALRLVDTHRDVNISLLQAVYMLYLRIFYNYTRKRRFFINFCKLYFPCINEKKSVRDTYTWI